MHPSNLIFALSLLACLLAACSDSSDPAAPAAITIEQVTVDIPSEASPAFTPGTPGVVVDNPKLLRQFGTDEIDFNHARYTRYFLSDRRDLQPDAVLILIPGFAGGASGFAALADNLLRRAREEANLALEVWAVDRRSNQLEDSIGLEIAEDLMDPLVGLDFLFGDALGLELSPALAEGPNRRVVFYNPAGDTAFFAQWTQLVHSLDFDAVVEEAAAVALSGNVFLGGHSAGTGFVAAYAATDFNLEGGAPEPGYAKLRGLVLLEGGGGRLAEESPDDDTLDRIEARFDGGLYGAVRDQAARCIDGLTACTEETEAMDCSAFENTSCTPSTSAYAQRQGLLSTELYGASEVTALDAAVNDESVVSVLLQDQGGIEGNNAVNQVPQLSILRPLVGTTPASSITLLGKFLDDDGLAAAVAGFLATSLGFDGPIVDGLTTWLSIDETLPADAFTNNGPPPDSVDDIREWGVEEEPTDLEGQIVPMFFKGATNFLDWYYPSSGLGVTRELGLDTTALSAPPPMGRGRSDIDNRTLATAIDIPVIAFGGSNGLAPVPASWLGFADAIAPCSAPTCAGGERVLDRANPNPAFPTFGGISGGFEVHMSEGYSHVDVLTAEDDETNNVIGPLLAFIERNLR